MLSHYSIIDLTHTLDTSIPTWTGRCGFESQILVDYHQGCRVMRFNMVGGIGTHIDAPAHFIQGAHSIEQLKVDQLIAPVNVLRFDIPCSEKYLVSKQDIKNFEAKHGEIEKGSFFVIHTLWDRFWPDSTRFCNIQSDKLRYFPSYSYEAIEYLASQGVIGIGTDCLSPETGNEGFPIHNYLLERGIIIIENLANLYLMPASNAFLAVLPIKIKSAVESPVRALGFIQK
ncbi:MAG: cyclase family protein [Parachlamydiales bacterium]|nr:cyclase family protein [Parachlamydiales bacterium]